MNTKDLEFTIDTSSKVLSLLNREKLDSSTLTFCLVGIDRLMKASRGLKKLIVDSRIDHDLEYSAAIVLRSVFSDALIILNAYLRREEDLEDFCYAALASSVEHLVKNVEFLDNEGEIKAEYDSIVNKYPEYFNEHHTDGTKPKVKSKSISSKELRNEILFRNLKNSDYTNEYSGIYQAYLYYSKYDHFGEIYHDFQELGYEEQIRKIVRSSVLFPKLLMYLLHLLFRDQLLRKDINSDAIEGIFRKTMKYNDASFGNI